MSNVVSNTTPTGKLINADGTATYPFTKWLQNIGAATNGNFDPNNQFTGNIGNQAKIDGRSTLASIVQFIGADGVVTGPGLDFAKPYANKNTDHIADGTGSPLAGGKAAEIALVTNAPAPEPSKWLTGLVAGIFQKAQAAFSDLSGIATAAQVPPLSGISGQITDGQLPASGITVTITTAKLTTLGADGSMTFTNGILTAQTQAT